MKNRVFFVKLGFVVLMHAFVSSAIAINKSDCSSMIYAHDMDYSALALDLPDLATYHVVALNINPIVDFLMASKAPYQRLDDKDGTYGVVIKADEVFMMRFLDHYHVNIKYIVKIDGE